MQADVRQISALREFADRLSQLREVSDEAINNARADLAATLETLHERQMVWLQTQASWEEAVDAAREELQRCEGDSYEDSDSGRDCSEHVDALYAARSKLSEALESLSTVAHWIDEVNTAAESFHRISGFLSRFTEYDLEHARSFLITRASALEEYAQQSSATASGISTVRAKATTTAEPVTRKAKPSRWVDKGIREVDLSLIDMTGLPESSIDFRKVSFGEMKRGLDELQTKVWPAVKNGHARDYFAQLDRDAKVDYEHGLLRVYEAFFGNEPIRLEKTGDRYDVVNGKHRLAIARALGIKSVPASVVEKGAL